MVASITGNETVKCSRDIKIIADAKLAEATKDKKYDVVILPGGLGGSKALASVIRIRKIFNTEKTS